MDSEHFKDDWLPTRNQPREFARRTLVNLEFIRSARSNGQVVHPVTQLANSLLGLIVYPHEKDAIGRISKRPLKELEQEGWRLWTIRQDDPPPNNDPTKDHRTLTIGDLLRHLRNGVAHRRIRFSADTPDLPDVTFDAEDAVKKRNTPLVIYWKACISGPDLLDFCIRLAQEIDSD